MKLLRLSNFGMKCLMIENKFLGYRTYEISNEELISLEIPKQIKLIETNSSIEVDLNQITLNGDERTFQLKLNKLSTGLTKNTAHAFSYVIIHALNGRRKISTVARWANCFSHFISKIRYETASDISTITLDMFNWYCEDKHASSKKSLRSFFLYWIKLKVPAIALDLEEYLKTSNSPKPPSTIYIQNNKPKERPFSFNQTRSLISDIENLYLSGSFDPQDYFMWRLVISEAMRPSQMRLLRCGDLKIEFNENDSVRVFINVPIVKQMNTPARSFMIKHTLSESVGRAALEHLSFIERLLNSKADKSLPLFCVGHKKKKVFISQTPINITSRINTTRYLLSEQTEDLNKLDLFTRRFKHTKLTHLAMLGAPIEVLARAGFQTSTVSLRHYVNLTEEAYSVYENQLSSQFEKVASYFKGVIVPKEHATTKDSNNIILDSSLDEEVGSCSTKPCNVFTPFACYVCPRFEAFKDGAHEVVLSKLEQKKQNAINLGLDKESIMRDDHLINAVNFVVLQSKNAN